MESHCTSTEKHSGIRRSDPLILDYSSSLITLTHRSPHSVERFHDLSGGGTPSPATPPCRCSREPVERFHDILRVASSHRNRCRGSDLRQWLVAASRGLRRGLRAQRGNVSSGASRAAATSSPPSSRRARPPKTACHVRYGKAAVW